MGRLATSPFGKLSGREKIVGGELRVVSYPCDGGYISLSHGECCPASIKDVSQDEAAGCSCHQGYARRAPKRELPLVLLQ